MREFSGAEMLALGLASTADVFKTRPPIESRGLRVASFALAREGYLERVDGPGACFRLTDQGRSAMDNHRALLRAKIAQEERT